jgi:small-conductance mechanosensitive channel
MRTLALLLFVSVMALGGVATAADAPAAGTPPKADPAAPAKSIAAPLVIGERYIVTFHAALQDHSPAERVEAAKRRLIAAYLKNQKLQLSVQSIPDGAQVLADGVPMFAIVAGDVNTLGGDTPADTAEVAIEHLQKVIAEREERTNPRALAKAGGLALAATLVWILVLRGIIALDRRVGRWAADRISEKASRVHVAGVRVINVGTVVRGVRIVVHLLAWAVALVASFLWLNAALRAVPHTRPWGDRLTGVLVDVVVTVGTAILDAVPGLLFVVVIFFLARLATRGAEAFFERVRDENLKLGWLDRDTAQPTRMLLNVALWLFAVAMAYPYLPGSQSQAFQGLSVLVGLMVSIGASSTVGQAASGLILMYTRAFRLGEYVRIGDSEGTVTEIGLVTTRLRTGMGEEILLPNSMVLQNTSKNYSRPLGGPGFVLDTTVTIGYDAPWRQVHAMLIEAARRVPDIESAPAPRVVQTALADFYVEYRLVAYAHATTAVRRADALGQLHAAIQDVFNEHGVQIMSPHYFADPAEAKLVPRARWFEPPAKPDGS